MWAAMVASVPMPFLSISPIKSDSDIARGGVVWPVRREQEGVNKGAGRRREEDKSMIE